MISTPPAINPIEEAEQYSAELNDRAPIKRSIASIARKHGKERSYISHRLRLLTLPEKIQDMIRNEILNVTQAQALIGIKKPERQIRLAEHIAYNQLSARQAQRLVNKGVQTPSRGQDKNPDTLRLERQISDRMGHTVIINEQAGHVIIDYKHNLAILDSILSYLGYDELKFED